MAEENRLTKWLNDRTASRRRRELEDIKALTDTPRGRRLFQRIFEAAGIFRTSVSERTEMVYFNEGQRALGLVLMRDLMQANPTMLLQMQSEFNSEQQSEQALLAKEKAKINTKEE